MRDEVNRKRKDDGGVLLRADGVQGLNIDGKYFSFIFEYLIIIFENEIEPFKNLKM